MEELYKIHTLPNGIRIIHKQVSHTKIAHCGFILDIGSRDEKKDQQGIAHFWEHMAFKGTQKRKAYHILNRLEVLGGELNAYTSKEKICFYASLLDHHFEKAIELLTDITFDSIFPENQIERERNVILEEMAMYEDNPDDAIQDEFDSLIFQNHPLGNNILGTTKSVGSFKRDDFRDFVNENLNTHRVIFSSVSNLPFEQVVRLAEKYMAHIPELNAKRRRLHFKNDQVQRIQKDNKKATQSYCTIGRTAYHLHHKNRLPLFMINNLLGGPGMNSKLNLVLREKHGLVYAVDSNYTPFVDTGLFAIYFSTEKKQLEKSMNLVFKELKALREKKMGVLQLQQAKDQLIGQLAMAEESNLSFMLMMGKSILDMDKIEPLDVIFDEIKSIKAEKIQDIANEFLDEDQMSYLVYNPLEEK